MIEPENMNKGIAKIGKLSKPPTMLRMTASAVTGKDWFSKWGKIAMMPKQTGTGTARASSEKNETMKMPGFISTPRFSLNFAASSIKFVLILFRRNWTHRSIPTVKPIKGTP